MIRQKRWKHEAPKALLLTRRKAGDAIFENGGIIAVTCNNKAEIIAKRLQDAELYTKHFGSFAKADYETLMFSIYLDMLEKPARDYEISLDLGITESKVRSLRVKSQLLYPRQLSWSDELKRALEKAEYDTDKMTITVMIEDPSVQNLLKNKIEETYGTVHLAFNPKLLTLPIESYLLLALELEDDKDKALKGLNEVWKRTNASAEEITKQSLLKNVWSKANKVGPVKLAIGAAKTAWPVAAPLLTIVESLLP